MLRIPCILPNEVQKAVTTINPYVHVLLFVFATTAGVAQQRVNLSITEVRDTSGVVVIALFRDETTFLKNPVIGKSVKASKGEIRVVFDGLLPGDYAVSIYHDANRNGKLDSNFLGIPREGFGFSNDAMGTFGPPSFEKAKFKVEGEVQMQIRARYF